jgi:hypothetical protein
VKAFTVNASLLGPTEHDLFSSFVNPHQLLMSRVNQQVYMPRVNQLFETDSTFQETRLQRPNTAWHEGFNLNLEQITSVFAWSLKSARNMYVRFPVSY